MAHLTRPTRYDIEDSNIALLGSDLEHRVREQSGEQEPAWKNAGTQPGLEIWRIEQFHVVPWPKERAGEFYDGDSYIVLHAYKRSSSDDSLQFDLHFWLGENTSQDEAGTAAYKTVELDDFLHGKPVQYREIQGNESRRFLSYFPHFVSLKGGVNTGFQHVTPESPLELNNLYQIAVTPQASRTVHDTHFPSPSANIAIRQVTPSPASMNRGDVFILDRGATVLQFNCRASSGKEKFAAAEFARKLIDDRGGQAELTVYDEGGSGASLFLSALGIDNLPPKEDLNLRRPPTLFRLSDSSRTLTFDRVSICARSSLSSSDAFLLDASGTIDPAIFVWIGSQASLRERHMAIQYAQQYLYGLNEENGGVKVNFAVPIVRICEGDESAEFWDVLSV